jgi:regulator of nucleoside diphosphate kinase
MGTVVLSVYDFQRLSLLLQKYKESPFRERLALDRLEQKLEKAVLLPPEQIPPNVVTLYSTVRVTDLVTRRSHQFTLVFPKETAQGEHRISVLAPIGIALLGQRAGSKVDYQAPEKKVRLRIDELIFQPEAVGQMYA